MAIINLRTVVISLVLCFTVISTVIASDWPEVYHDKCVRGSCRWQCNDDTDWCWVASYKRFVDPSEWVTCTSDADCTKNIEEVGKKRTVLCRSSTSGYRGLGDLKCVKKDMDDFARKDAAERQKEYEEYVKRQEARKKAEAARLKMVEEKLGPEAMEDIAARIVQPGKIVLPGDGKGGWKDKIASMIQKDEEARLVRARQVVRDEGGKLEDKDLKLTPEELKERLFNVSKESFKRKEKFRSIVELVKHRYGRVY